jgi:hypothetical protein
LGAGDGAGADRCTGGGAVVSGIAGIVVAGALVAGALVAGALVAGAFVAEDLALDFATFFAGFVDFFAARFLGADFATFFFLRTPADFDTALDFLDFLALFAFFAMIVLPIVKG